MVKSKVPETEEQHFLGDPNCSEVKEHFEVLDEGSWIFFEVLFTSAPKGFFNEGGVDEPLFPLLPEGQDKLQCSTPLKHQPCILTCW